jgi:hypothetical protein
MMDLDELVEKAHQHARTVLVGDPQAQILPSWLIQFKNRPTTLVATPWGEEREKIMIFGVMRMTMRDPRAGVVSYSFMTEGWKSIEYAGRDTGLMPSQREDKIEVVIINACDRERGITRMYEMVRGPDGAVTELKPERDFEECPRQEGGRAINLLLD